MIRSAMWRVCLWAGLAVLLAAPAAAAAPVRAAAVARIGALTLQVGPLVGGPSGSMRADVSVSNAGHDADELDATIAPTGAAAVYHARVSVGELPNLAGCGGEIPSAQVVETWLHYGPMLVPGHANGAASPAHATLTLDQAPVLKPGQPLAITFYFAHAGAVTVRVPVA